MPTGEVDKAGDTELKGGLGEGTGLELILRFCSSAPKLGDGGPYMGPMWTG